MLRLIVFFLFVILLTSFFIANSQNEVAIYYYFNLSWQMKIYVLAISIFLLGILISVLFIMPEWISMKTSIKIKNKQIDKLNEELSNLRKQYTKNNVKE